MALRATHIWSMALLGAMFFVCIDRLLKVISAVLWYNHPQHFFSTLNFVFVQNHNIAFSLKTGLNPLWIIIPIIIFLTYYFFHLLKNQRLQEASAFFFILSGAMSNLYDRLLYGFVIDYIDLKYFTVFNIADVMICGGVMFLLYYLLKNNHKEN